MCVWAGFRGENGRGMDEVLGENGRGMDEVE
jgi:hypothetical protein